MMFPEKVPFGVNTFTDASLRSEMKKISSSKSYVVTPEEQRKVLSHIKAPIDSYKVVAALLTVADEMCSYSLPVYKALTILVTGLRQNPHDFRGAVKTFLPEVRSILYCNFGDTHAQYRDQVHYTVQGIIAFLSNRGPLPENDNYVVPKRFVPKVNKAAKPLSLEDNPNSISRPPPIPQESHVTLNAPQPRQRSNSLRTKTSKVPSDDEDTSSDFELPFDIRSASKSVRGSFNPFSSHHEFVIQEDEPTNNVDESRPSAIDLIDVNPVEQNISLAATRTPPAKIQFIIDEPEPPKVTFVPPAEEEKKPEPAVEVEPEPVVIPVPKPEGLDNPRDISICTDLQLIRKSIYDDTIESY